MLSAVQPSYSTFLQCTIIAQCQHSVAMQEPVWPLFNKAGNQECGGRDKKGWHWILKTLSLNINWSFAESSKICVLSGDRVVSWKVHLIVVCVCGHRARSLLYAVKNPELCRLSDCQDCLLLRKVTVQWLTVGVSVYVWVRACESKIKSELNPTEHLTQNRHTTGKKKVREDVEGNVERIEGDLWWERGFFGLKIYSSSREPSVLQPCKHQTKPLTMISHTAREREGVNVSNA